ncbi:hypothetical protein [Cytobacillus oceanisediminis]|uniref:hypothetical protein n=1 Tax=Cytobacillus oceanisediminis TaxID=665099 RepID=UPI00373640E7
MKTGDWIKVNLTLYTVYGYLLEAGEPHVVLQVYREYKNGEKDWYSPFKETTFYNVTAIEAETHPDDLRELVNMAIDTADKEWFIELSGREKV